MKNINNTNKNEENTTVKTPDKKGIHSITFFWTITVIANSLLGAFIFLSNSQSNYYSIAGMTAAIISCIALYSTAEVYLRNQNKHQLALELRISACIRILLQPISDFWVGFIAIQLTSSAMKFLAKLLHFNSEPFPHNLPTGFISTYITTMVHALLATLIVVCILGVVKMLIKLYKFTTQEKLGNMN